MVQKIAGAALNQTPIDWKNNLDNIREAIQLAKIEEVKLLCLPELCITGYGCEDIFLSEWLPKTALEKLLSIIPDTENITVSIGLPFRFEGILYNVACLISNGNILGFVPKQFLANDGVHYEPRWFTPWIAGKQASIEIDGKTYPFGDYILTAEGLRIGYEICEDAWREDVRPGISLCKRGVDIILNPSASHFSFGKSALREEKIVRNGSERFRCAYLYVNLLGNEAGRIIYDGEIQIALDGKMVERNNRLSFKKVNLVTAVIDFKSRKAVLPIAPFEDARDKDMEMTKAISLGLFDYMRKSRSNGFVLSLSGGADSSLSAVAVAEMTRRGIAELGLETFISQSGLAALYPDIDDLKYVPAFAKPAKVTEKLLITAYQWTANSSMETFNSAKELAASIGATFYSWNIDKELKSYTDKVELSLSRKLEWETDDLALQNIQARTRSPIIWMFANIKNALLITTSNRSEGDVGYATMDGDTSGSIAPIGGIDKEYVLQWLLYAEKQLGYRGLSYVNNLTPTAELRPQERVQTDEKDLMPYSILKEIELLAVRQHLAPAEVYLRLKSKALTSDDNLKNYVVKFYRLWSRNQWKRERIAPSFLLDDFNVDPRTWCRFPILSGGFEEELRAL